ncbi:N-acetyl-gamma-glutamyl-phosphate reductase [Acetobacter sp. TBRC 12305]|uniref:N-acetyl-gamma-glutamyl-phosphate reductase n=1 Tax=Acetobacter garciniae TaxID=2817435 RepID=A0A939HLI9_9PROT|nr:N-acetyl-gamma-glutamyl-phosphate reductase [Acetobacter garciniae]MBO1324975.1 N-acetyl-gamma-glutamyl-phosphate reductase [Acetobacter garciniae]MBX0344666.1 N-acetyl-gamma-glutamyl-phosphate reductase [Acetobacter garciniae]
MAHQPIIFIDGEAGTTGLGIRERLAALPVTLHSIDPARRKDPAARRDAMQAADLAVLCLPDDASREAVALAATLGDAAPRILDASTAFRTDPGWVYGFPELEAEQANAIATAPRVSNPGCYPTGAVGLLRPLVRAGVLPADYPVCINAVSGYSGGGRSMIEAHERDGGPAFELYGLALEHKHVPEIHKHAALTRRPVFVPSAGHFAQGMIVSIPLHLDDLAGHVTAEDLHAVLATHYAGQDHVRVLSPEPTLSAEALAGSDRMELRVHGSPRNRQALLSARLDNLGKGASGAALQNIRLMLGLD